MVANFSRFSFSFLNDWFRSVYLAFYRYGWWVGKCKYWEVSLSLARSFVRSCTRTSWSNKSNDNLFSFVIVFSYGQKKDKRVNSVNSTRLYTSYSRTCKSSEKERERERISRFGVWHFSGKNGDVQWEERARKRKAERAHRPMKMKQTKYVYL